MVIYILRCKGTAFLRYMQERVLFFKIVYKEVVDGSRHRTGEGVGDVNHRVI